MKPIEKWLFELLKAKIKSGDLIGCIRIYRDEMGTSLLESKNCVERIRDEMRENGELPGQVFIESTASKLLKANALLARAASRINKLNYLSNQEESDELATEIETFLGLKE